MARLASFACNYAFGWDVDRPRASPAAAGRARSILANVHLALTIIIWLLQKGSRRLVAFAVGVEQHIFKSAPG